MTGHWQYFHEPGGQNACVEIIGLMGHESGALLDLLERKHQRMTLAGEDRPLGDSLGALILSPPDPRHGVIYAELTRRPRLLLLVPFVLINGGVPEEVRLAASDRFKRWASKR